jgi:hypothetical protein
MGFTRENGLPRIACGQTCLHRLPLWLQRACSAEHHIIKDAFFVKGV